MLTNDRIEKYGVARSGEFEERRGKGRFDYTGARADAQGKAIAGFFILYSRNTHVYCVTPRFPGHAR